MKTHTLSLLSAAASLSLVSTIALAADPVLDIGAGTTHSVENVTALSRLVIGEGATLTASNNRSLTLTVNGVGTAIAPGTYRGKVVLTPTDEVVSRFNDMGLNDVYRYRTGLYVDNGAVIPSKSVAAAVVGGKVDATSASNIRITSKEDKFNGIWITGDSSYTINNARLDFTGNGGNDFQGFGAAIKTDGKSRVTINNAVINTRGVVRTAIFVGGDSVVHVNRSRIDVRDGTLPADYKGGPITGGGGVMMEPPWVLGIVGNARATNVIANGEVHYNDSVIRAQRWGSLSTDATRNVKLFCNNSTVEVVESGYGSYADGVSMNTFQRCRIKAPDYGLIMTGGSALFTERSRVDAGRNAVMMHSGGRGTLTIDKGSVLKSGEAVFQPKSSFPKIVVDGATLQSRSGVILEAILNDDPVAAQMAARMAARGIGANQSMFSAPGEGPPGGGPPGGGPPGGGPPGGGPGGAPAGPRDIEASFANMSLTGDIINSMTSLASVKVALVRAQLVGAVSTATAVHADGEPTRENYRRIGRMKHTFQRTEGDKGVEVSLDGASRWTVTKTSYLTALSLAEGATVSAPKGRTLVMSVNGQSVALAAGNHRGAITLTVQ